MEQVRAKLALKWRGHLLTHGFQTFDSRLPLFALSGDLNMAVTNGMLHFIGDVSNLYKSRYRGIVRNSPPPIFFFFLLFSLTIILCYFSCSTGYTWCTCSGFGVFTLSWRFCCCPKWWPCSISYSINVKIWSKCVFSVLYTLCSVNWSMTNV